jgi:hypothetical protein
VNGFKVDLHFAIRSVLSSDYNFSQFFGGDGLDGFRLLEANLSGLVIIDDGNFSFAIFTFELLKGVWVV